jgi:hypothetical protein
MATLITGGTGLIGADVAKLLVERGEERPALFDLRPSDRRLEELGPGFDLNHGRHLALDKDAPGVRLIARPEVGTVVPIPEVGGLHYRNVQRAASSASPRGPRHARVTLVTISASECNPSHTGHHLFPGPVVRALPLLVDQPGMSGPPQQHGESPSKSHALLAEGQLRFELGWQCQSP